jgi:uncharacterized protein
MSVFSSIPLVLFGNSSSVEPDCACAAPPAASLEIPVSCTVEKAAQLIEEPLNKDWTLFFNPLTGGNPVLLNPAALRRLDDFTTPQLLQYQIDEQLLRGRLVVPSGADVLDLQPEATVLTSWIHVTNACNLDCPYCYVRKSSATLALDTAQMAIDALLTTAQKRGMQTLKLKYAGGEAALHYNKIQAIHHYALSTAHSLGIAVEAVVLSNGTYIPEAFADWLADNQVKIMISLDGVGVAHDIQRPWKSSQRSAFAALEDNLLNRLFPRGIKPDISITVTGRNADTCYTAAEWAIKHNLPFSVNFYREINYTSRYPDLQLEERQIIHGMLLIYQVVESYLPKQPFINGLLDRVHFEAHSHACGVNQSYVVITHQGQVTQCHMNMEDALPLNGDQDLIALAATGPLHTPAVDEKIGCRDCSWRYLCAGGCPVVTLRATGRTDVQSPHCNIYKTLIPKALQLEGLRILKIHGQTNYL